MGRLAIAMAASISHRYVVLGRRLFAVRRVDSDALRRVGWAALEGSGTARRVDAELAEARREAEADAARASGDAALVERVEAARRRAAEIAATRLDQITSTPEGDAAFRDRCDAYICAAVIRIGALLDGAPVQQMQVLDESVDPATVAQDLREDPSAGEPVYSEAFTFVRDEAQHDPANDKVWVKILTPDERVQLGLAIMRLQAESAICEVTPFRTGSGDAGAAVAPGGGVPGLAARGAGAGAVAAGPGREVPGGPAGGDAGPGPRGQGDAGAGDWVALTGG